MAESSASEKALMRAAQVCQALDIQPYQLKFWETEFLELGRRVGPKRLYGPAEVEIASEIKSLLVDARLNLSEARSVLGERFPLDVAERDIEPVDGGAGTAEGSDSHVASGPAPQDSRLAQAEDELRQLRSRVVILERALADARAEARALADEQRSELAAERTIVASLREALENARRDVKQATESLSKEQTKSRTLKSDLSNATERVAELETRLEALAHDAVSVRRLEEDIAALEERLATSERSRLEAEDAASIRQEELLAIRRALEGR
ncbi:MAG: MerR family transcriptional regulator [Acidobacteria bacterium]|nr:MerR family transcriptional regulator [Acidobacteriota bacterium]